MKQIAARGALEGDLVPTEACFSMNNPRSRGGGTPVKKGRLGRLSERAGRNASERRAGLENVNAEAAPPSSRGRLPATGTAQWGANENGRSSPPGYWRQHARAGKRMQHGKPCRWRARANRKPVRASSGRQGGG